MNEFEVLTLRDVSFNDENTGKVVSGIQLWVSGRRTDGGWHGVEVCKLWIAQQSHLTDVVSGLMPGNHIRVNFNRYGKPDDIEVL